MGETKIEILQRGVPANYARRFVVYMHPTAGLRSALLNADTGEVLAVELEDNHGNPSNL